MYFNTRVVDRVLLVIGRNHSAHFVGGAPAGQVSTLYHDTRLAVRLDNGLCAQRTLQVSAATPQPTTNSLILLHLLPLARLMNVLTNHPN